MGPGGCRSTWHFAQRWMRSSPASTASQKKALSWVFAGRGRLRAGFASDAAAPRHALAVLVAIVEHLTHEASGTKARLLLRGDRIDLRGYRDPVARAQVAHVLLAAVRGDHARVSRFVEQVEHARQRVGAIGLPLLRLETSHRPRLQHGRRRHDSAEVALARRVRIRVHGVAILHGVAPMTNHRLVHRIAGDLCRAFDAEQGVELGLQRFGGHGSERVSAARAAARGPSSR
jgi:hypothetical protein